MGDYNFDLLIGLLSYSGIPMMGLPTLVQSVSVCIVTKLKILQTSEEMFLLQSVKGCSKCNKNTLQGT
jgi:hypothetical protein